MNFICDSCHIGYETCKENFPIYILVFILSDHNSFIPEMYETLHIDPQKVEISNIFSAKYGNFTVFF